MPRVGLKITLPVFHQSNTLHARDGTAALIGQILLWCWNQGGWTWRAMRHAWRVQLVHHRLWSQDAFGKSKSTQDDNFGPNVGEAGVRVWPRNEWFRTALSCGTLEWAVDKCEIWQILTGKASRSSQEEVLSQSLMLSVFLIHQYEDPLYHLGGRKLQCSHHPENVHINSQVWSFVSTRVRILHLIARASCIDSW
jgi:hypothetical protein